MAQFSLLLIYFPILFSTIISLKPSLAANFIDSICSNTTMFANNTKYQTNLNTLFQDLRSNATNRYDYNATAGVGTNDVIYGHFHCRGDQSISSCKDCVASATIRDLPIIYCPNRKVAIIWYDECTVRYLDEPFFGMFDYDPEYILSNTQNVTGNVSQFIYITNDTLKNSASQAAGGGSDYRYGTSASFCKPDSGSRCGRRPPGHAVFSPSLPPQQPATSNATETGAGTMIKSPSDG